jgi:hypothetical protein
MDFNDSASLKGFLKIQVFDAKSGEEIYREEKNNLICKNSKVAITGLLAQRTGPPADNTDYARIWAIYVGDSDTAPTTNQTDLQGANKFGKAVTQDITVIPPSDSGILEMEMTLESGEHNSQYLRECGLFTRGDSDTVTVPPNAEALMLARQIHGEIYKTSGIAVKYTWRYQITA